MRVGQFLPFRYVAPLIIAELHPSSSSRGWVLLAWDRNFPLPIFGVSRRNFFTIWALWPDSQWRPGLRWARFDFSSRCWKGRCDEKLSSDRDVASGALSNIVCWPLGFTLSISATSLLSVRCFCGFFAESCCRPFLDVPNCYIVPENSWNWVQTVTQ